MNETKNSSRLVSTALIIACTAVLAFAALILPRAELNQDEGWYLYGSGLIREGLSPYVDFATTQGPVMQYVYSFFWRAVESWGVLGGRILTFLFGLTALLLSALTVFRLLPVKKRKLGVLAFVCFAGLNAYQILFFSVVKTYALTALGIAASFLLLSFSSRRKHLFAFCGGVMIMLAAATRLSAGAIIPGVIACLLLEARRNRTKKPDLRWLAYGIGAALCMMAVMGPFLLKAPEGVKFAMLDYHSGRSLGSVHAAMAYKAGFLARVARAYYPALIALAGVLFVRRRAAEDGSSEKPGDRPRYAVMVLVSVLLVTVLHFAAPFPYDDYQAMIFPLLCVGIVLAGSRLVPDTKQGRAAIWGLLAALVFAGSSSVNEQLFIGKRDRIWWPLREETSLHKLRRAAAEMKDHAAGSGEEILTQDLYIAVEAGLRVDPRLALGPFSYFPGYSRAKAEKLHVLNEELMRELIASTDARVAAVSDYGFAISAPGIIEYANRAELISLLEGRFSKVESIEAFGQAETDLDIYVRKQE